LALHLILQTDKRRYKWIIVFLTVCSCLTFLYSNGHTATQEDNKTEAIAGINQPDFEEKWGIKILNIRLSAGGYMLDFRYRVKDPEKASPLFDRKIKPYLIDQASGAKFLVPESPKVGALRQTRKPVAEKNYFIIFANPGKYIKKGNKVAVVIGDFKAEDLTVQ
jgi:hypothetical protein